MVTEQQKAEIELAKFREFSNRMALPIDPESIVKRQPPEPDILCLHDGGEYVAFELMEICASDLAKAMSKEGENTFLWLSDPTSNILKKKLSRRYETDYPVELYCTPTAGWALPTTCSSQR